MKATEGKERSAMKGINVLIFVKNVEYGNALARGLCNECTNLKVFFEEGNYEKVKEENWDVLLTDCYAQESPKILHLREDNENVKTEYDIPKTSPISDILSRIESVIGNNYGIKIDCSKEDKPKTIFLKTYEGGAGVTSTSIMIARYLAVKDESVLYLNLGPIDDYCTYINLDFNGTKDKRQYYFLREQEMEVDVSEYTRKDRWGVSYFRPEERKNSFYDEIENESLIWYLERENIFSCIVVDCGKVTRRKNKSNETMITIIKRSNLILSKEYVESDLLIKNFYDVYEEDMWKNSIEIDNEAFVMNLKNIEILMDSRFFEDIKKIVENNESIFTA